MNRRYLPCGKQILAIGSPLSIADCKEKLLTCFECKDFCFCQLSQEIFEDIKRQQNSFASLERITNKKEV